ncbi:MAG: PRC-barrel domain-containing protein [Chloroflexota bacterium]|nr:PRC-barrel domain-containing protein [Chloroflexota bacterium]
MTPTTQTQHDRLVKLGDTDLTVHDPAEDIRGHTVADRDGKKIGKVDGLMIDRDEQKVRYLQVEAGGFLGIGERRFLIPVDAITRIGDDTVQVNETQERIIGAPGYDPKLGPVPAYWGTLGSYYGYMPFWGMGYGGYPMYPYYGMTGGAHGQPEAADKRSDQGGKP